MALHGEIKVQTIQIGDRVPDVQLQLLNGRAVNFSDYKGTSLIVFFWGSW